MEATFEINIPVEQHVVLFGPADSFLRHIKQALGVRIIARDSLLTISGEEKQVDQACEVLRQLQVTLNRNGAIGLADVRSALGGDQIVPLDPKGAIPVFSGRRVVKPSTAGQQYYLETMLKHDVTFCTGPAGSGKTYLAVAVAVSMLKRKLIRRIILARPAVEAGEKLGFLPGDLQAKVNPYLRPLFDALEDMMEFAQMRKFLDLDIIEVIPLAFMRGRTFNQSVVICDEAQNTSAMQMLMVLTRLGHGSKMIITGDVTQTDLDSRQRSGLVDAIATLQDIEGIGVVRLTGGDIVRHQLVQSIVQAYGRRKEGPSVSGEME